MYVYSQSKNVCMYVQLSITMTAELVWEVILIVILNFSY